ncbi:MAG: hypothetical protein Q8Q09_09060 [Deltaproteobacteria bacterium]|nr:hypothetical protein [Deltaproteobacteria bacterium]
MSKPATTPLRSATPRETRDANGDRVEPTDVLFDVAADAPVEIASVIQFAVQKECRAGGVTFTAIPTSPFRGPESYRFQWTRTRGTAMFTATNNSVSAQNNATGDEVHFDLTVQRDGYPDAVARDVWAAACNTAGSPTTCPENTRDLVTNQESYAVGDTFDARLIGTTQTLASPWYVLEGVSDAVFSEEGRHVVARVTSLPIHVHAQPNSTVGMAVCHGWTERWFYAR